MKELSAKNSKIQVKVLPAIYPQGGEKVLVYHTTGRTIKVGELPADSGCIVCNSSTMANIGKYLQTGMPLVEKVVTVDGGAVKEPKNVIVAIGTPIGEVFDFCGGFNEEPEKVIYGGPMMGVAVPDLTVPVLKQTNALLAFNKKKQKLQRQQHVSSVASAQTVVHLASILLLSQRLITIRMLKCLKNLVQISVCSVVAVHLSVLQSVL